MSLESIGELGMILVDLAKRGGEGEVGGRERWENCGFNVLYEKRVYFQLKSKKEINITSYQIHNLSKYSGHCRQCGNYREKACTK